MSQSGGVQEAETLQKSLGDVRAEQLTQQTEWAAKLQQAQEDLHTAKEEALASKDAFEAAARQAASNAAEATAERERLAARMAAQQEVRMTLGAGARHMSLEDMHMVVYGPSFGVSGPRR
jgi:hypothetical protein